MSIIVWPSVISVEELWFVSELRQYEACSAQITHEFKHLYLGCRWSNCAIKIQSFNHKLKLHRKSCKSIRVRMQTLYSFISPFRWRGFHVWVGRLQEMKPAVKLLQDKYTCQAVIALAHCISDAWVVYCRAGKKDHFTSVSTRHETRVLHTFPSLIAIYISQLSSTRIHFDKSRFAGERSSSQTAPRGTFLSFCPWLMALC